MTSLSSRPRIWLAIPLLSVLLLTACEHPPVDTVQRGYRGLGMEAVINPRKLEDMVQANLPPAPQAPVPSAGP